MAGVSAGTVDRIIHNRGRVSEESLEKVRRILDSLGYKNNIHASAISLKKSFKVVVAIPSSEPGEYWDLVRRGIAEAEKEFCDVSLHIEMNFFDELAGASCASIFDGILAQEPSAVIVSSTFVEETRALSVVLEKNDIPYVLLDGDVEGTHPLAVFAADQVVCGRILARLLLPLANGGEIATLIPSRVGKRLSNNTRHRSIVFTDYLNEIGCEDSLKQCNFTVYDKAALEAELSEFLRLNPLVRCMAVLNSTSYVVSDALRAIGRTDIRVGGFDVTENNARCLREGTLDFVVSQQPERQGFNAVEATIRYLMYGALSTSELPRINVEIILKENLSQYQPSVNAE